MPPVAPYRCCQAVVVGCITSKVYFKEGHVAHSVPLLLFLLQVDHYLCWRCHTLSVGVHPLSMYCPSPVYGLSINYVVNCLSALYKL